MNKVLIITYYWPPSSGSGVQRWLKFVKYLPQYNWQPIVVTPLNPSFDVHDNDLLKDIPESAEILKYKIWEPYNWYKKLFGKEGSAHSNAGIVNKGKGSGWKSYVSNWIRGNVFIPDPKIYWVKPCANQILEYLKKNEVDVIISTGPPHSMHLIAKKVHESTGIPWIADFRDPWSELDMLESYHITKSNIKRYQNLERSVLQNANLTLTVSNRWKEDFKRLGAKRVDVITNGFDDADFTNVSSPEKFVISHFGLLNHLRNPSVFWKALDELAAENSEFKSELILQLGGSIAEEIKTEIHRCTSLRDCVKWRGYINHNEVILEYERSAVLLLLLFNSESGKGNIPGKIFEYLAARRPIIAFGPGQGDSSEIIENTSAGTFLNYNEDLSKVKDLINNEYQKFKKDEKLDASAKIYQYSRKELTKKLTGLLHELARN